jgi:hypothetical protein
MQAGSYDAVTPEARNEAGLTPAEFAQAAMDWVDEGRQFQMRAARSA